MKKAMTDDRDVCRSKYGVCRNRETTKIKPADTDGRKRRSLKPDSPKIRAQQNKTTRSQRQLKWQQ